jgi:CRP/FNR family transcriptional regulator
LRTIERKVAWQRQLDQADAEWMSIDPGRRRATGVEYAPITVTDDRSLPDRRHGTVVLSAGDVLFGPGDVLEAIYRVVAGRVELVLEGPRERELVLLSVGPGALVGEDFVFSQAPSLLWAVAATEVVAVKFDRKTLLRQMSTDPGLVEAVLSSLAKKLETATIRLHNVTFMTLECRVAKLLLAGAQETRHLGLVTFVTHSEIARCTGSCRVAVTRSLKKMTRDGLVTLHRGHVRLLAPERLGHMACLAKD